MASFLDVCRFTPTLGGTTDWTYSAAVVGYQSPTAAKAVNGSIYRYRAESADLSQWEIGYGAYNSSTGVFARTTVLFNSLGTTAKVAFSTVPQVAIVALAEDLETFAPLFVFEGDSLSNISNLGTWPTKLAAANGFFARGAQICFATDGDTAANMVAEYATQGATVALPAGAEQYYFLWAGTNDISASTSAATIYGYLTTMWAAARASGYKVVAFTMKAVGSYTATQNGIMASLNALILSNPALYDYVIRLDALFVNSADTFAFLSDATHLTAVGNLLVAQEVANTILSTPSAYATPADAFPGGLLVNGAMEVSQELGTAAKTGIAAGTTYVVDGVDLHLAGSMIVTSQQVSDAPPGLANSLQLNVTTAEASLGASDFAFLSMRLEGYKSARLAYGTNAAQPVSIGFWTKIHRIGTYSVSIVNAAGNRSYVSTFSQNVADAWEFKTVTIPGDVIGTWPTGSAISVLVTFSLAVGTTFSTATGAWSAGFFFGATGAVNGVAATTDVFKITGVIMLPGIHLPSSQKLPLVLRPFDQELIMCQRFWQKSCDYGTAVASAGQFGGVDLFVGAATTSALKTSVKFPVAMRTTPTVTLFDDAGTSGMVFKGASGKTGVADQISSSGFRGGTVDATSASELFFHWTANSRL